MKQLTLYDFEEILEKRHLEWFWNYYNEVFGELKLPEQDEVNAILSDDTLPAPVRR